MRVAVIEYLLVEVEDNKPLQPFVGQEIVGENMVELYMDMFEDSENRAVKAGLIDCYTLLMAVKERKELDA